MVPQREDDRCTIQAPAKLNLYLHLLGKRHDGFHELETVMTPVRMFDRVAVEASRSISDDELRLSVDGDTGVDPIPTGKDNLVVCALDALRNEVGEALGAKVRLTKRIPSQAGLGGGSSDAAAALIAGNRVWGLGLPLARLGEIGARLGSDIPFFVHAIGARLQGRRIVGALCTGRGEKIEPLDGPAGAPLVIVKPAYGLSTAEVYGACEPTDYNNRPAQSRTVVDCLRRGAWREAAPLLRNTLQNAAERVAHGVTLIRQWFERANVVAHQLSGSGTAYFALCHSHAEARRVACAARAAGLGRAWATGTA